MSTLVAVSAAVAAGCLLLLLTGELDCRGQAVTSAPPAPQVIPDFSYDTLRQRAQTLAGKPYLPEPSTPLPDFLKQLTYDQYQTLHFRPEQGPWRGSPMRFSLQFFHRGYIYQDPVAIYLVEKGHVTEF